MEADPFDVDGVKPDSPSDAENVPNDYPIIQQAYPTVNAATKPLVSMSLPVLATYVANFAIPVTSVCVPCCMCGDAPACDHDAFLVHTSGCGVGPPADHAGPVTSRMYCI